MAFHAKADVKKEEHPAHKRAHSAPSSAPHAEEVATPEPELKAGFCACGEPAAPGQNYVCVKHQHRG